MLILLRASDKEVEEGFFRGLGPFLPPGLPVSMRGYILEGVPLPDSHRSPWYVTHLGGEYHRPGLAELLGETTAEAPLNAQSQNEPGDSRERTLSQRVNQLMIAMAMRMGTRLFSRRSPSSFTAVKPGGGAGFLVGD